MFDFNVTAITQFGIIICAVFYFCVVGFYWKPATTLRIVPNPYRVPILFTLVLIFSIISWYNGDWIHYLIDVKEYRYVRETGLEEFYDWIIVKTNSNYLFFRTIVWGLALAFFTLSLREFKVDPFKSLFFLFAIFINYFDYSRSSLGMATYFLGIGVLFGEEKMVIKLLGVAILLCSYFFHRSMMIPICLTPICFIPFDKKTVVIIIVLVIVLFGTLKGYFNELLEELMKSDDEDIAYRAQIYGEDKREAIVSGSFIGQTVGYWKNSVFYVVYGMITYFWFKYQLYKYLPMRYKALYSVATGLLITAIILYLFDTGHAAIYYRTLYMIYIPLTILSVCFYCRGIFKPNVYKFLFYYCGGYVAFEFIYRSWIGA